MHRLSPRLGSPPGESGPRLTKPVRAPRRPEIGQPTRLQCVVRRGARSREDMTTRLHLECQVQTIGAMRSLFAVRAAWLAALTLAAAPTCNEAGAEEVHLRPALVVPSP